jgi:molybdate transport system substrate-binding protein
MRLVTAALLAIASLSSFSLKGADLLVAAASSLSPLTPALEKAFGHVRFTTASSGALAQQIENGAPFDVFLSADDEYPAKLAKEGKVDPATLKIYARGKIAVWSAKLPVRSIEDLKKPQVTHVALPNPEHAPYGEAAKAALEKSGAWGAIQSKIVYGENVRQALQFAESGNADAVITSWTLLAGRGTIVPENLYPPIRQAAGVVVSTANPAAAREFLKFLTGAEGQKILAAGGLFPP